MLKIIPIPIFNDNYVWTLIDEKTKHAACVDPGSAEEVLNFLDHQHLTLSYILITHHHMDHTGGVKQLQDKTHAHTFGPEQLTACSLNTTLIENNTVKLDLINTSFSILETPGHTLDHIVYYNDTMLFSGDTLFSMGCGRLFEGDPAQMLSSLKKIYDLNDSADIYCAHEYTLDNIAFAKSIYKSNALYEYEKSVKDFRAAGKSSLPSKLSLEKELNPFLRGFNTHYLAAFNDKNNTQFDMLEYFTFVRKAKDSF